jgi:glycosyltransferase involved in cell wall biosynthesis
MAIDPGSVWLDARGTQSVGHAERGIARYVTEHALALLELAPEAIGWIGLSPDVPVPPIAEPLQRSGKAVRQSADRGPAGVVPPIYHVMSPFEAELGLDEIWPPWSRASRLVVTLYDLIPLIMRERYNADWRHMATAWIARLGLLGSAHQILTISQQTADDAMERLNIPEERITVIDSGVSDRFSSLVRTWEQGEEILRSSLPKVRPGFLLYVGGVDYRKNLEGAIRGYAELPRPMRDAHQLVIACNLAQHLRFSLRIFAEGLGIESRNLLLTGFVSDRDLAALYRSCELFVFPSLYEGAGLPILEAMTCGAPVASSGTSAMPELLGDTEATFDPADPADIARCVRDVLETPGKLEALRERSRRRVALYTWERVARRTLDGYERALQIPFESTTARPLPFGR